MAKTLVIRGANFESNRLAAVEYPQNPCTGLTLDQSTASLTAIGETVTLTAATAPAGEDFTVTWTSSNASIASVSGGVVTAAGIGSATITAACGSFSATCAVTVTANMATANQVKMAGYYIDGNTKPSGGNGLPTLLTTAHVGALLSSTGTYTFYNKPGYYPYELPYGTNYVRITLPTGISMKMVEWFNRSTCVANTTACMLLGKLTTSDIPEYLSDGAYVFPVPSYEGYADVDAFAFSVQSLNEFTDEHFTGVTAEFLTAAP